MSNCGTGYVWLELQDNDRYETTATGYAARRACQRPDRPAGAVTSTT